VAQQNLLDGVCMGSTEGVPYSSIVSSIVTCLPKNRIEGGVSNCFPILAVVKT